MDDPENLVTTPSHSLVFAWLPIVGAYGIFMLGNMVLPSAFWHSDTSSWLGYIGLFCSGILVSELAVLGGWLALSSERLSHRTLIGGVLLCLTTTCLIIGLRIADRSGPPLEWCLFLYGLSVLGCVVGALPLGWLRWRYGWQIKWKYAQQDVARTSQVSIAYILSWMSAVAIMVALIRSVVPTGRDVADLAEVAVACSILTVYTVCLSVPSFWLAMQSPTPYWVTLPLIVVLFGLAPATMSCITWFLGNSFDNEEILFFYLYSIGFVTSVFVVIRSLRQFGYALGR